MQRSAQYLQHKIIPLGRVAADSRGDASELCSNSWLLLCTRLVFFTKAKSSFFCAGKKIME